MSFRQGDLRSKRRGPLDWFMIEQKAIATLSWMISLMLLSQVAIHSSSDCIVFWSVLASTCAKHALVYFVTGSMELVLVWVVVSVLE